MQQNTLMAQPFDTRSLAVTGFPRPVVNGVLLSTGSLPVFGVFSVSQNDRLVYLSPGSDRNRIVSLSPGSDRNAPLTVLANWTGLR
jgi:hypothetical protein